MEANKPRIIVTGAAGFVGSNLCLRLVREGYRVTGLDSLLYGDRRHLEGVAAHPGFSLLERDVSQSGALDDVAGEVVVHLASHKIPRYGHAIVTIRQNNLMMNVVLEKCRLSGCRLLFASTSDVYGKNPAVPYHEGSDSLLGPPTVRRWAYAVSKLHAEHAILGYAEEYGMAFGIARLFGSYGPRHHLSWWGGPQSEFISASLRRKPLQVHGDGRQSRSFLYIDDVVDGLVRMIETPEKATGIFNLASDPSGEITIGDLAALTWRLVNGDEPLRVEYIPYKTFGAYEDVPRRTGSSEKAHAAFGFLAKTGLEEGLRHTIAWQRKAMGS